LFTIEKGDERRGVKKAKAGRPYATKKQLEDKINIGKGTTVDWWVSGHTEGKGDKE